MGIVSSSAISHVTNKKQPKFQWNIDNDVYVNYTFVISKVFTFDKENFVALYNQQLFSLIIYCCSALQWSYDETFQFKLKINIDKRKISTVACFSKSKPFVFIKVHQKPKNIQIKIQIPKNYPYTRDNRYVGIRNSGATCYIAAIIQVLYNLGGFRQFIFSFRNPPKSVLALQNLFVELQLSSQPPSLDPLIRSLGSIQDLANVQHDSNEFLLCLFERLEQDLGNQFTNGLNYIFELILEGTVSVIKTPKKKIPKNEESIEEEEEDKNDKNQEKENITKESFIMMPLIVDGLRGIIESLTLAVAPETVSKDQNPSKTKENKNDNKQNQKQNENKSKNNDSNDKKLSRSHSSSLGKKYFTKLPPVIGFQLCRYKFSPSEGCIIEIRTPFDCPDVLDMGPFSKVEEDQETVYNLFAVVCHSGNPNSGHYISYIHLNDKWMLFDDTKANPVDKTEVETTFGSGDDSSGNCSFIFSFGQPLAYMVFYVRKDSNNFIYAGDNIPLHLAPHLSNRLFSKFIFYDELIDYDIQSHGPYFEWDLYSDTFKDICLKQRPTIANELNKLLIWANFPGNSMFIGPISMDEIASKYVIKGHPTIFFVLPKSFNKENCPLFILSETLPRKVLAVSTQIEIFNKSTIHNVLIYNGRSIDKLKGYQFQPGTFLITQTNTPITITINEIPLNVSPYQTYSELQQRIALMKNTSPTQIIFFNQQIPMKPDRYPYAIMFPHKVSAFVLPQNITARSISLFTALKTVLMYPSYAEELENPIWVPKNGSYDDVIKTVLRMNTKFRVNEKLKVLYSKGTAFCIKKVLHVSDSPKKGNARFDIVRYEVPSIRSRFKDMLEHETPMTIEVRLVKNQTFYEHSRLLSVTKTTTLRDIGRTMLRISKIPIDTYTGYLFLAEKTKITEQVELDETIFSAMNRLIPRFTAAKQRICLAISTNDAISSVPRIPLSRSQSGSINLIINKGGKEKNSLLVT